MGEASFGYNPGGCRRWWAGTVAWLPSACAGGLSTQRARVCLYVTLINNTVDVVSFPSFVQFILHTAATVVWNHSYVTEMAPGQKRHTSQARFSYAAEPHALLCTG